MYMFRKEKRNAIDGGEMRQGVTDGVVFTLSWCRA